MDLVFRDLSEDIKKKCLKAKTKKDHPPKACSKPSAKSPKEVNDQRTIEETPSLRLLSEPYAFTPSHAALFFFHDYVLTSPSQDPSLFDLLPSIYATSSPSSPLSSIITALGLVCLSNTTAAVEPLIPARARYVSALHSINDSIRDPGAASADETLIAVLLLGLYEDNTSTPGSLEQWSKHTNGAQALLDVRGAQQLKTHVGRQLITNLRTSTIANCLLKHTAVPACIMRWSALLEDYETPEETSASTLATIVASFCELQAFIDIVGPSSESIVPMALQIDSSLESWAAIEISERPITHSTSSAESPLSFPFTFASLSYASLPAATHWNHHRAIRIMLHSLILAQLDPPSPVSTPSYFDTSTPHTAQITLSTSLIITLCHAICASVSFCLNLDPLSPKVHQPEKAAYAKLLLWPLYTAGKSACVPAGTAEWVADTFDFIAKVTGVRKGASLAKALRAWPVEGEEGGSPKAQFAEVRQAVLEGDGVPCSKGMYLIC